MNAEICLGTVTNVEEAVQWLSYTYLYVRMRKNPLVYGMKYAELKEDPLLEIKRTEIIRETARKLDRAKMIRFDERTGYLFPTDLGKVSWEWSICENPNIALISICCFTNSLKFWKFCNLQYSDYFCADPISLKGHFS